jgi:hypothetical protein
MVVPSTKGDTFGSTIEGAAMNDDNQFPLTMSVPEAGKRYFGLSRNASYDAAERGEIPTIKVGRLLRVSIRAMERRLDNADNKASR